MRIVVRLLIILIGIGIMFLLGSYHRGAPQTLSPSKSRTQVLHFTGTGEVVEVRSVGQGCRFRLRLHKWISLSEGFSLSQMPQKAQLYSIEGNAQQCDGLEVALASQTSQDNKKHIYFTVAQTSENTWKLIQPPKAPLDCGGL